MKKYHSIITLRNTHYENDIPTLQYQMQNTQSQIPDTPYKIQYLLYKYTQVNYQTEGAKCKIAKYEISRYQNIKIQNYKTTKMHTTHYKNDIQTTKYRNV